jgi:hypothetical protein
MDRQQRVRRNRRVREGRCGGNVPGIVILDGGEGSRTDREGPKVRAFLYGEDMPVTPTLPFGRWKAAS